MTEEQEVLEELQDEPEWNAAVSAVRGSIEFLLEGVIYANQGSSEWCLNYLRRAVERGIINREQARALLFNVVRADGYWRNRFDQIMPEE